MQLIVIVTKASNWVGDRHGKTVKICQTRKGTKDAEGDTVRKSAQKWSVNKVRRLLLTTQMGEREGCFEK